MARETVFGVLFGLVVIAGCGGGANEEPLPTTVPVVGVVTMDGDPLSNATLTFIPHGATKGIECVGSTDETGHYELTQIRGEKGAPPGEYRVVINRYVLADGTPVALDADEPPANVGADESLPPKYSSFTDTTLTAVVGDSGGEIPFALVK